jgi:hypothetical protein
LTDRVARLFMQSETGGKHGQTWSWRQRQKRLRNSAPLNLIDKLLSLDGG